MIVLGWGEVMVAKRGGSRDLRDGLKERGTPRLAVQSRAAHSPSW